MKAVSDLKGAAYAKESVEAMNITLDKKAKRSLYRQLRDQLRRMVDDGALPPGARLPGTRELAEQLGVSRKTVLTAFVELEAESYLESIPQSGTFVKDRRKLTLYGSKAPVVESVNAVVDNTEPFEWERFQIPGEFFAMPPRTNGTKDNHSISFTKALPDDRLFPFDQIKQITSTLLWYPKDFFFNYGNPQGYQPLVEYIEGKMALDGVDMAAGSKHENHVIITNGFQSALNLILTLLVKPGDTVAIENPTYAAILNLLIARGINYVGIPVDDNGMRVDELAGVASKQKISAVITIPTFHNPTGTTLSLERRHALLRLAEMHKFPIIEDAYANDLRYSGEVLPTLKSLDRGGYVLQIGSFSKTLLPGLRLGWITLPVEAAQSVFRLKRACDKSDSFFLQVILHEFIKKGHFDRHLKRTRRIYRSRLDAMVAAMREHFPKEVTWYQTDGGLSLWVNLPKSWKSMAVYQLARERGVEFAVANFFWSDKHDSNGFRLSFAQLDENEIVEGIKRLGELLREIALDPSQVKGKEFGYEEL